jgi:dynactin complex subunit
MWATHSTLELVLNPHLHIIRTRRKERIINEKDLRKHDTENDIKELTECLNETERKSRENEQKNVNSCKCIDNIHNRSLRRFSIFNKTNFLALISNTFIRFE